MSSSTSFSQRKFRALGTGIFVKIVHENSQQAKAQESLGKVKELYFAYHDKLSRFSKESELSKLNENLEVPCQASQELIDLSKKSLELYRLSKGLFDPRILDVLEKAGYDRDFEELDEQGPVPLAKPIATNLEDELLIEESSLTFKRRMDFTGIAKGYITDKVRDFLGQEGWKNFLVDSGGDMFCSGLNDKKLKWAIEFESIPKNKMLLQLSNQAVATSGIDRKKWQKNGQQKHHLIDPAKPNHFSFKTRSISVVAQNTIDADAWAKILFLMGKQKGIEMAQKKKIACAFLSYDGSVILSKTLSNFL